MGRGGVEPPTHEFSVRKQNDIKNCKKDNYENSENHLAQNSAILLQKYPDLAEIVNAWPNLSESIRKQILTAIKLSTGE
jgi:hypothetical protein